MNKTYDFIPLFNKFISESKSGKRTKKNGALIGTGTIQQYTAVRNELMRFITSRSFPLHIKNMARLRTREIKSEQIYWKRFYKKYTDYLFSLGCYDNYVGLHFKVIRTFFNYLRAEKQIFSGDFHKSFYVRNENIPIIVFSITQLKFLIYDTDFEGSLPLYLKKTKDISVFGCTVGLRFFDLMNSSPKELTKSGSFTYLKFRSTKTKEYTRIKLPDYALDILKKYKGQSTLLPKLSLSRLNLNLKELCERAGWVHEVGKKRERRGKLKKVVLNGKSYRFCDLVTTHTMRKTAITTLLGQGVTETVVRNISGHGANSKEFYRYVKYAQEFVDMETDRAFAAIKVA